VSLRDYFQSVSGTGILATADAAGKVNLAVYAIPHFLEDSDQRLAFVMSDRLSHDNITVNPHAAYLFIDNIEDHTGKRLFLTKIGEEDDQARIDSVRRHGRRRTADHEPPPRCWLVHFRVDGVRPLVGTGT
jgi:hypothetical protein